MWACILPMGLYIDSGTGFSQVGVPNYPRLKIPLSGEYCPDSKLELLYCRVPSLVPKLYTVLGEIRTCVIVGDVATCLTWSKQSTGFWSWIMLLALRKYCSSVSDGQLGTFQAHGAHRAFQCGIMCNLWFIVSALSANHKTWKVLSSDKKWSSDSLNYFSRSQDHL